MELHRRPGNRCGRQFTRALAVVGIADWRWTQIEPAMGLDAHGVEEIAAEEFEPDNPPIRVYMAMQEAF